MSLFSLKVYKKQTPGNQSGSWWTDISEKSNQCLCCNDQPHGNFQTDGLRGAASSFSEFVQALDLQAEIMQDHLQMLAYSKSQSQCFWNSWTSYKWSASCLKRQQVLQYKNFGHQIYLQGKSSLQQATLLTLRNPPSVLALFKNSYLFKLFW